MKSRILHLAALAVAMLAGPDWAQAQGQPVPPIGPPAADPVLTAGDDTVYGSLFGGDEQCGCCNGFGGCGGEITPAFGYTRFDLLFMRRSAVDTVLFASNGTNLNLSTGNLDNRFEGVGRFALGVPICQDIVLEGVYMGLQEWSSRATLVSPTGSLLSPYSNFGNFPPGLLPGQFNSEFSNLATIGYSSRFNSAEMNVWCRLPPTCAGDFWLLQGVRYFQQREHLDYTTVRALAPAGASNTNVNTENDLVGYQLGLRWSTCITGCLHLDMEVKSGVYLVNARQDTITNATLPAGATRIEQARQDDIAMVSEGDLTLVYDVCPWLSIGGGYRVLDVFGVALAPDNFAPLPPPATGLRVARVDTNGNVFYQGASLKLEVRY